jgi:pSer/pThr/pTyr-binding forkhead associated (FHA) protein
LRVKVLLVAFKPDGTRVDFRVRDRRCVIGRDTDVDLRIPVGTVSRQHCEVRIDDDEPVVRDLGSSNGTFLNGKRVTESVIDAGDLLRVGPTTFTVVVDGIPDVVTPPSEHEPEPDGSSMMEMPARPGPAAGASAALGAGASEDLDDEDDATPLPKPTRARNEEPAAERTDDPFSKMVERQDDDDDFDFDFFDDDEDDEDD